MADRVAVARGMRDLSTETLASIKLVEDSFAKKLTQYAYEPIRLPMLENTALFSRGLGESTDAVSKEMFVFEGGSSSLALRPEGTASCVRAAIAEGLQAGVHRRLWYNGSMFRYERPQRGRYREFYQCGAEALGFNGPDVDAELVQIVEDVLVDLDLRDSISLEINTLGSLDSRIRFRGALVDYFTPLADELDEDSQRRLQDNPMRILDSKNPRVQQLVSSAPLIWDHLDESSRQHFDDFCEDLTRRGIQFEVNRTLVRGLDYYTHAVFEWNTERLGAQKQLGGGGRYDGLCELLGGPSIPASGFAMGVDRMALLLEEIQGQTTTDFQPDVYVLGITDNEQELAIDLAKVLREQTTFRVQSNFGGGKLKLKMRNADRSGARFALIIGEDEASQNLATLKWLREEREQVTLPIPELVTFLTQHIKSPE